MHSTKDFIADAMVHELSVIQHLLTKLPESAWDFRPQENIRSTVELLRYISFIGAGSLEMYIKGGWQQENIPIIRAERDKTAALERNDFHQALEDQKERIRQIFASITDEQLTSTAVLQPWGMEVPLIAALLNSPLKYLTAYKMQLYLYAKLNGAELGTLNAWQGKDAPPKVK